ncbi:hypothetical protein KC316_g75 [Hortaea werneckii]|nr:hypothetical protein KC316_g75 [Hortaea werneckii]
MASSASCCVGASSILSNVLPSSIKRPLASEESGTFSPKSRSPVMTRSMPLRIRFSVSTPRCSHGLGMDVGAAHQSSISLILLFVHDGGQNLVRHSFGKVGSFSPARRLFLFKRCGLKHLV